MAVNIIKKATAQLVVECLVECPSCHEDFNLFQQDAFSDDGWLYKLITPHDDHWSGEKTIDRVAECPECETKVLITTSNY